MMGEIKPKVPDQTIATMVTSSSTVLIGEHMMGGEEIINQDFPCIVQEIDQDSMLKQVNICQK